MKNILTFCLVLIFLALIVALWLGFFWKAFITCLLLVWCFNSISKLWEDH